MYRTTPRNWYSEEKYQELDFDNKSVPTSVQDDYDLAAEMAGRTELDTLMQS